MKKLILLSLACASTAFGVNPQPITNGVLTTDADANGKKILNLDILNSGLQPHNANLDEMASLATDFGLDFMEAADSAAGRTLLGLHGAAILDVGTLADTVAAGNDSRLNPTITAGSNVSVTGTWPNLTIAATGTLSGSVAFADVTSKPFGIGQFPSGHLMRDVNSLASDEVDTRISGRSAGTAQDIFSSRNDTTHAYVRNTSGILGGVDLTATSVWSNSTAGIGALNTVTLVAPDFGITANHVAPNNGDQFYFVTQGNVNVILTVAGSQQVTSGLDDIRGVKFTTAAPTTITPWPILVDDARLNGAAGFFIRQNQRANVGEWLLGPDTPSTFTDAELNLSTTSSRVPFWTNIASGDSSHPLFAVLDGRAVLIGTAYGTNPPDYTSVNTPRLSRRITDVNAAMASLGSSYTLTPFSILTAGSAASKDAAILAGVGQIPVVDATGKLDASVIPPGTGAAQSAATVFAGPLSGAPAAPAFRPLAAGDLPPVQHAYWALTHVVDADYTIPAGSDTVVIFRGAITAPRHIYLPTPANIASNSQMIMVGDQGGTCSATNTITVHPPSGWTIGGASTIVLSKPGSMLTLVSTGPRSPSVNDWVVVARYPLAGVPADVGLSAVTNDAQTKAAVVSNTAPTSGQLLIGQTAGNYVPVSLNGDATLTRAGLLTISSAAINFAKMQNLSGTGKLMGRATAGAGSPEELTLGSGLSLSGSTLSATDRLVGYTVATLPAGTLGDNAYVTDGDASLAWGATVVNSGAGATKYRVWFNATNWTVTGK